MRPRPQAPHSPLSVRHHPDGVLRARFDSHHNVTETVIGVNGNVTGISIRWRITLR
jgi:hypothetical protein